MAWFFAALSPEARMYAGEMPWLTKILNLPPTDSGPGLVAISGKKIERVVTYPT